MSDNASCYKAIYFQQGCHLHPHWTPLLRNAVYIINIPVRTYRIGPNEIAVVAGSSAAENRKMNTDRTCAWKKHSTFQS